MTTYTVFPRARLEALADYYENVAKKWLAVGESSRSGLVLQEETMAHADLIRQAIAAYEFSQEQLRVLGEGLRPGAVIDAPPPPPGEDDEPESYYRSAWVNPPDEADGFPD